MEYAGDIETTVLVHVLVEETVVELVDMSDVIIAVLVNRSVVVDNSSARVIGKVVDGKSCVDVSVDGVSSVTTKASKVAVVVSSIIVASVVVVVVSRNTSASGAAEVAGLPVVVVVGTCSNRMSPLEQELETGEP